jgi:potassium efflux system protein
MAMGKFAAEIRFALLLLFTVLGAASLDLSAAAEGASSAIGCPLTVQQIEAKMAQTGELSDLDEGARAKITALYQMALSELKRADELTAAATQYRQLTANLDDRLAAVKKGAENDEFIESSELETLALEDLLRQQNLLSDQVSALKQRLGELDAQAERRSTQRKEIRHLIVTAPERIESLKAQLQAPAPPDESKALSQARCVALQAQLTATLQEVPALEAELASYDAEEVVDFLRQQRDLLARQLDGVNQRMAHIEAKVGAVRTESDNARIQEAQRDSLTVKELLAPLAARNLQLAEEEQRLTKDIVAAEEQLKVIYADLEALRHLADHTQRKVNQLGSTGAIGLTLRRQRSLPLIRQLEKYKRGIAATEKAINDVQLKIFENEEEQAHLVTGRSFVEIVDEQLKETLNNEQIAALESDAEELLKKQENHLDAINRSYNGYFDLLAESDSAERQLAKEVSNYRNYIDGKVLWIRSGERLSFSSLRSSWEAFAPIVAPTQWLALAEALRHLMIERWWIAIALLGAAMVLLSMSGHLEKLLEELGSQAERNSCLYFAPTAKAVAVTLLLSAPWAIVLACFAWLLRSVGGSSLLALLLAQSFWRLSGVYFFLQFWRQLCRPQGVLQTHLNVDSELVKGLHRQLSWLIAWGMPVVAFILLLRANDPEQSDDGIERVLFIGAQLLVALFLWRLFKPRGALMKVITTVSQNPWWERGSTLLVTLLLAMPLLLALLAYFGYYYTAQNLALRLQDTVMLIAIVWLIRTLLRRLLQVYQRRLSMQQAKELRTAVKEASESDSSSEVELAVALQTQKKADLALVASQAVKLLDLLLLVAALAGLWAVWIDLMPALNVLDSITLGSSTVQVVQQKVLANGTIDQAVSERLVPITLRDLCISIMVALLTFAAARNGPGLLDMAFLLRLPLDAPARYAIRSLCQYGIVIVGIAAAFSAVGIGWSQVQWLIAAISLGLGFGLQEIFANFVSGLILLFERPVRIGDMVTIDNTSGMVTRIGTRATTIVNWERKEYIVPNKELITGKLLNWTLTDSVNRIAIEVGVAYGSDTKKVCDLLLEAAQHPHVLKDPPPLATFEGFGDSTLKCVLRVFLVGTDKRLEVVHHIHTTIDKLFREAGIDMAFTQRELHIRSWPEKLFVERQE